MKRLPSIWRSLCPIILHAASHWTLLSAVEHLEVAYTICKNARCHLRAVYLLYHTSKAAYSSFTRGGGAIHSCDGALVLAPGTAEFVSAVVARLLADSVSGWDA
jgi:hypothetical protein